MRLILLQVKVERAEYAINIHMYYIIYKITNINTGQFYIGSHKTHNVEDGYFGSGIYLKRAIKKYGKAAFIKEILHMGDNMSHMIFLENQELSKIKDNNTYNLKFCSMGGNTRVKYSKQEKQEYIKRLVSNPKSPIGKSGEANFMFGKTHTAEYKQLSSVRQKKYFKDLKVNNPEKYKNWYNNQIPGAILNCLKNAANKRKKIVGYNKITGDKLEFDSVTECMKYLKITWYRLVSIMNNPENDSYMLSFVK